MELYQRHCGAIQHGGLQINWHHVRRKDLIGKVFIVVWGVFARNKRNFILKSVGVIDVRDGSHNTGHCICGKLIYVKSGSHTLDGGLKNLAIREGHFGYEFAHWRQIYQPKMVFRCGLGWRCYKPYVYFQVRFLCWIGGRVVELQMATNNNAIYNGSAIHGNKRMHKGGHLA